MEVVGDGVVVELVGEEMVARAEEMRRGLGLSITCEDPLVIPHNSLDL